LDLIRPSAVVAHILSAKSGSCSNGEEFFADTGRIHGTISIVNIGQSVGQTDAGFHFFLIGRTQTKTNLQTWLADLGTRHDEPIQ
jgi:hypothetical protein